MTGGCWMIMCWFYPFTNLISSGRHRSEHRGSNFWEIAVEFRASQHSTNALFYNFFSLFHVCHSQNLEMLWHFGYCTSMNYVFLNHRIAYSSLITMNWSLRLCLLFQLKSSLDHVYFLISLLPVRLRFFFPLVLCMSGICHLTHGQCFFHTYKNLCFI